MNPKASKKKTKTKQKPGPDPETLNAEGVHWKDAVHHALNKPKDGWPDEKKGKHVRRDSNPHGFNLSSLSDASD
jgi:hypothetical protein